MTIRKKENAAGAVHQVLSQEDKYDQILNIREKVVTEVVHLHKADVIDGEDHTLPLDLPHQVYTPIPRVIELVYH